MANSISHSLSHKFRWVFNYDIHYNGRICLGWDPNIWTVQQLVSSAQHIYCSITKVGKNKHFFLFVYAYNTSVERRPLQSSLLEFKQAHIDTGNDPWVVLGDFNDFLDSHDVVGGNILINDGMWEFEYFMDSAGLFDLNFT